MNAEEYIRAHSFRMKRGDSNKVISEATALKMIEIAREEEREKVKNLLREAYNAINNTTGLCDIHNIKNESSLSRRLREYSIIANKS